MVFTVASGIIGVFSHYLFRIVTPVEPHFFLFNALLQGLGFLVNPILFVSISYFLGKNLDLTGDLRVIAISLFIGCVVGNLIGHSISILQSFSWLSHPQKITSLIVFQYLSSAILGSLYSSISSFLVGFAGLALGYLRRPSREWQLKQL